MAGSRKGERRGGARLGTRPTKPKGPHKPKFDAKTGTVKPKPAKGQRMALVTGEREREMLAIITGKSELMPKDVQLATMRTLFGLAHEYQQMMLTAIRAVPSPEMPAARIDATVEYGERKMVEYLMLSSQVARDAAPFIHPRLAALAVTTDRTSTRDLFDQLLDDINETPRLRAIEHRADESKDEAAA